MGAVKSAFFSVLFASFAGAVLKIVHFRRKQTQRGFYHRAERAGRDIQKKISDLLPARKKGVFRRLKMG